MSNSVKHVFKFQHGIAVGQLTRLLWLCSQIIGDENRTRACSSGGIYITVSQADKLCEQGYQAPAYMELTVSIKSLLSKLLS